MKLDPKKIITALEDIVNEYNFTPEEVYNVIKMWIKTAFRKDYLNKNKKINLEMIMSKSWDIKIYRVYDVIDDNEEIEDEEKQIHLKEAKKENKDVKVWDKLFIDITPKDLEFSRISVQSAVQTIKQQIKKIEKERFYRTFADSEWDILVWKVKYVDWEIVVLEFGENTVILPIEWQIKWRIYNVWEEIKVLLKSIKKQGWDIILEVTQSAPEYVEVLFRKYIPEIQEGLVDIVKTARIAWEKTKILVSTDDDRIDPVWVCIWEAWDRINSILDELDWERVDVIEYVEDKEKLIRNIFSPAKISDIEETNDVIYIYADETQKPILFWKKAVNVKLASRLLNKKVFIK